LVGDQLPQGEHLGMIDLVPAPLGAVASPSPGNNPIAYDHKATNRELSRGQGLPGLIQGCPHPPFVFAYHLPDPIKKKRAKVAGPQLYHGAGWLSKLERPAEPGDILVDGHPCFRLHPGVAAIDKGQVHQPPLPQGGLSIGLEENIQPLSSRGNPPGHGFIEKIAVTT